MKRFNIAHCQLMPHSCHILKVAVDLVEESRYDFTVRDLVHSYSLIASRRARFILTMQVGKRLLALKVKVNNHVWGNKYFIVKKESLGDYDDDFLRSSWVVAGERLFIY